MTICSRPLPLFPACSSRKVQVDFEGGHVSSDGGVLLVREVLSKVVDEEVLSVPFRSRFMPPSA